MPVLRQFGLIENEQVDCFLASAFAKTEGILEPAEGGAEKNKTEPLPKSECSEPRTQTE